MAAFGSGMIPACRAIFPVLAPLPGKCRHILQNQLKARLPAEFSTQFSSGVQIAYAVISIIGGLEEPLQGTVRDPFAKALSVVWKTGAGLCGVAILMLIIFIEVPMVKHLDDTYGFEEMPKAVGFDSEGTLASGVEP
ncbi:hypothetical protein ACG7TL_003369 [Trametes sanguinea]